MTEIKRNKKTAPLNDFLSELKLEQIDSMSDIEVSKAIYSCFDLVSSLLVKKAMLESSKSIKIYSDIFASTLEDQVKEVFKYRRKYFTNIKK